MSIRNYSIEVTLKLVPRMGGTCFTITINCTEEATKKLQGITGITVLRSKNLLKEDIPNHLRIFITPKNNWHGAIYKKWNATKPFKISTFGYEHPVLIRLTLEESEYHHFNMVINLIN